MEQIPARPAPPPVPFDQWLLSERNIKIALYTGGLLLVLAGLIFIGVNWERFPGPVKFAITLMFTGLMYLGGYLLFKRPTLRIGGVAMLAVASGFLPLNFAVLQIYIFAERGLSSEAMWLIGSLLTLLLYALTAYWTRAELFTYLSLAAIVSALTAALALLDARPLGYALAYAMLMLAFLLCARALKPTALAGFTCKPLLIVAHTAMPVLMIFSAALWIGDTGCASCPSDSPNGSPWLALATMFTGVLFYVATDIATKALAGTGHATTGAATTEIAGKGSAPAGIAAAEAAPIDVAAIETTLTDIAVRWPVARWVAAFAFAITFVFLLIELRFDGVATGFTLMALALAYLLLGYVLQRRAGKSSAAWPLYAAGYAVAGLVTVQALAGFGQSPDQLAKVLIADAILLVVSAWVHRRYEWLYAAAWVFIAPVFIYTGMYLPGIENSTSNQAARLMFALAYLLGGYVLERRGGRRDVWWLYAAVYTVAGLVTAQAALAFGKDPAGLANALIGDVILLVVSAWVHRRYEWIYGAAWVFIAPVFIYTGLYLPGFDNGTANLAVRLALAMAYLLLGYVLERRVGRDDAWWLYVAAYTVAGLVTAQAALAFGNDPAGLANALIGDVILLVVSAWVHRRYEWLYGAAWLFIAPVFIYTDINLQGTSNQVARLLLAFAYLLGGYVLERRVGRRDVWWLYAAAYTVAGLVTAQALAAWDGGHILMTYGRDPAGLANALIGDVILLVVSAWVHRRYEWIYGAAWVFIAPVFIYTGMYLPSIDNGTPNIAVRSALALAYLLLGYVLERRVGRHDVWWLYAAAYTVAGLVTAQALREYLQGVGGLANALIADVILLAVSAWVHRRYEWIYGAVWLFMAPVYIYAWANLPSHVDQGLVMGVLMLNYVAAGYILGRRALKWGEPFLTAAAFLSVALVVLTWSDAVVASIALALVGVLYLLAALWLKRPWLLLPALAAANLLVVTILRTFFTASSPWAQTLTLTYAGLGVALALGGAWLGRAGYAQWRWPLYLVAALDLAGSYLAGLWLGGAMAIGLSAGFAALAFGLAWVERATFAGAKLPPLLSYLGAGLIFAGHFYVIGVGVPGLLSWASPAWPAYTAGLCALFVLMGLLLRGERVADVYGTPLRWSGICLMALAMAGAMGLFEPMPATTTFVIAGTAYAADAVVRRSRYMAYLAGGVFAVSYATALLLGGLAAIGLSAVYAVLAFAAAWVDRKTYTRAKLPPLLTYLGLGLIFAGHFYLIGLSSFAWSVWPAFTACLCALFMALAWLLRGEPLNDVYGEPLRWSGSCLMLVALVGVAPPAEWVLVAATFAIAGTAYATDAAVRGIRYLAYLAGAAYVVAWWAILLSFDVRELQAYVIPPGLALLAAGWNERRLGGRLEYLVPTLVGLSVLMGSAFYQSLDAVIYAVLLLVESLVALAWGIRIHSRGYVEVAVLALLVNAVAQLGPGFVELPRFVHLAVIGFILFGGGLVALLRRDQLLATRKRLAGEWRGWAS